MVGIPIVQEADFQMASAKVRPLEVVSAFANIGPFAVTTRCVQFILLRSISESSSEGSFHPCIHKNS